MKDSIFDSVEDAIKDIAEGKMIIVTDDEDRENEGDIIMAADKITPATVNFMIKNCRGLICIPTTSAKLSSIGVEDMVKVNRDKKGTAFTVTIDAAEGISTGVSSADRARTIKLIADVNSSAADFVSPGHLNPLRSRAGGVLERAGHTEAAVDLCRLANLPEVGVICEITNDDGTMSRVKDLISFKQKHDLKMITVASLIEYRLKHDRILDRIFESKVQTKFGEFDFFGFKSKSDAKIHYALSMGDLSEDGTLVRVHAQNIFAELFNEVNSGNLSESFTKAMEMIASEKRGVLVCISLDNWGVDIARAKPILPNKIEYGLGSQILKELGLKKIKLLTRNLGVHYTPDGFGIEIVSQEKI
ncbi:MAG: 3,4-dihydroxy-2-butanone-4-phosphate synthase [Opitutales bacterium]